MVTCEGEAPPPLPPLPPPPRYHRFYSLELRLRSVTTKWLQRLRRQRELAERFMVGFAPFGRLARQICTLSLRALGNTRNSEVNNGSWAGSENIFGSAHFDISVAFALSLSRLSVTHEESFLAGAQVTDLGEDKLVT